MTQNSKSNNVQNNMQNNDLNPQNELIVRSIHYYRFPRHLKEKNQLDPVVYPHLDNTLNIHLIVDVEIENHITDVLGIKIDAFKYENLIQFIVEKCFTRYSQNQKYDIITQYYAANYDEEENASTEEKERLLEKERLFKKLDFLKYHGWEIFNSNVLESTFCWIATKIANIGSYAKYCGGKHLIILLGNEIAYANALHEAIVIGNSNKGELSAYVLHTDDVNKFLINPLNRTNENTQYHHLYDLKIDKTIAKLLQMKPASR